MVFNISLAVLFLLIGLTDFFDGYYARKFGQETGIGKILDPIADKVLLASVFIVLVAIKRLWFFWAVLLIGRELFIGGLRQIACESQIVIHVSWLGKCKTAVQIMCCAWIIANPYHMLGFTASIWNYGEFILIIASCMLSWLSAHQYYKVFKHDMLT